MEEFRARFKISKILRDFKKSIASSSVLQQNWMLKLLRNTLATQSFSKTKDINISFGNSFEFGASIGKRFSMKTIKNPWTNFFLPFFIQTVFKMCP